jgi:hypothetical protein
MCDINTTGLWTSGMNMIYKEDSDKAARPVSHRDHNKKNAAGVTKYIYVSTFTCRDNMVCKEK